MGATRMLISVGQLLANTADGGFVVDHDMRIVAWNQAATALLGYSSQEVIGHSCDEILTGRDDHGRLVCTRDCAPMKLARTRAQCPSYNLCARSRGDRPTWLNVTTIPVVSDSHRGPFVLHLFRSIDRHKHLEAFVRHAIAEGARAIDGVVGDDGTTAPLSPLSRRERDVLRLLARGRSSADIASVLGISRATVRTHTQNILVKLGVHSTIAAVALAKQHDLL